MSEASPFGIDRKQLEALAAPFDPVELAWRAIQFNKEGTAAIAYAYVNPRAVMERLETVFPGEWDLWTEVVGDTQFKVAVRATITLGPIRRTGMGEAEINYKQLQDRTVIIGEPYKSAESDAIKRAAMAWGVARYLYSLPAIWIEWEGDRQYGHFKVDPSTVVFDEKGNVKSDAQAGDTRAGKRGRGKKGGTSLPTSSPALPTGIPGVPGGTSVPSIPPTSTGLPTPGLPAVPTGIPGVAAPTAPGTSQGAGLPGMINVDAIDRCQVNFINGLYVAAGATPPPDLENWTRKQASEIIHAAIKEGGNTSAPTASQIELISKMISQLNGELPAELAQLNMQTASTYIQQLIAAVR